MKAAVCKRYGPPEVLQIQDMPIPVCKKNEVLVKVMATSVNSGDVKVRGLYVSGFLRFVMRIVLGFTKPRKAVLGIVYSGIIEKAGDGVTRFRKGESVFGMNGFQFGSYAEYIAVNENAAIAAMPAGISFEEAASLPFGWHTAIYFLQKAGIQNYNNPRVLIYGATGSVGTAAMQFAKYYNATVTAVCSTQGKEFMKKFDIAEVIFYDEQDYTRSTKRYDIIFDAVGKISFINSRHLLNAGGRYITVSGLDTAHEKLAYLHLIRELSDQNKCKAVIDRVYPFDEIVAAHHYVESGKKKGDVVLTFQPEHG